MRVRKRTLGGFVRFNSEVHYLGKACANNHGFNGLCTRYKSNNNCVECRDNQVLRYKKRYPGRSLEQQKEYRESPKGKKKRREYQQKYKKTERYKELQKIKAKGSKHKARMKRYLESAKGRASTRKQSYKVRQELRPAYLVYLIKKHPSLKGAKVTGDVIALKREQVLLHRKIKKAKGALYGTNRNRNKRTEAKA